VKIGESGVEKFPCLFGRRDSALRQQSGKHGRQVHFAREFIGDGSDFIGSGNLAGD
jgi:hypothetical protein